MIGIRNPGFELGNTDFWGVETAGVLEIETLLPKYGTYCGKFTSGGDANEFILSNDFMSVSPHDLIGLSGWAKSITTRYVYPCLYTYDLDYSYIGYLMGYGRAMDNTYLHIITQIPIPGGVGYVRPGYRIGSSAVDEIFYLDGYGYSIIEPQGCISGSELLFYGDTITASDNTRADMKDIQMYNTFEADLIVTYTTGTNETLDVVVYEMNAGYQKQIVGAFTQATGVTQERITLTHCTGRQLHIEYVLGGTNPRFDFKVYVVGKGL